jgi:hypothetical protein
VTSALRPTAHAAVRMSQRGIARDDIELIKWIGTEVPDGYLVLEKNFQALSEPSSNCWITRGGLSASG